MTMVATISVLLALAAMLGCLYSLWALACNERTYRDRMWLAEQALKASDWHRRIAAYEQVSYDQHLRCRLRLRDPFKLYSPLVWGEEP